MLNDFEREKSAKRIFDSNMKSFKAKLVRTNKIITGLMSQLGELETSYNLSKEDIALFHKIYENGLEEVYTNEYSKGENGITTYYSDGTKDSLVFEQTEVYYDPDFKLEKVVKRNR